jgi:UDP-N-acetylglucosamine 1-carboxyvinyltransferase
MESFLIQGGTPLSGTVRVSGSKNSALPILAACLMAEGKTVLRNVPKLVDVSKMIQLIGELGCHVKRQDNDDVEVEVFDKKQCEARYDIVKDFRASICVLGPLLAARGKAVISLPVGGAVGDRPMDVHVRGLQKLGAEFRTEGRHLIAETKGRLKGCRIYIGGAQGPTVLGTINLMCAAVLAEGETVLVGASCDPEVKDCGCFLGALGADIKGHGTPYICIKGTSKAQLRGIKYQIRPDRIEAGTLMIAAAITGASIEIQNAYAEDLVAVIDCLEQTGTTITETYDWILKVAAPQVIKPVEMTTQPYPGFPTDLQAQLMALLCLADGTSVITERVFPDRFLHIAELNCLGANIRKDGPTATIKGVSRLVGSTTLACDPRASVALVLAALAAKGETKIERIHNIDRGYEKIDEKLNVLGAKIKRVSC